jgi:hypothetical protein
MTGGTATEVINADNKITHPVAHGLTTGLGVLYSTGTGGTITNLTNQTTYYVVKEDAYSYQLASSKALAVAATPTALAISHTADATAHTFTLTPIPMGASTSSFVFQQSNDGVNFMSIPVISSGAVTTSTAKTIAMWDLGWFNYRWLRLNFTGPATGGVYLKTDINVKE